MTYRDLCLSALRLIGVATEGYTPTSDEINDALECLKEIIDSWNVNGNNIYTMEFLEFDIGNSQKIYTIGPTGDFTVPVRPMRLEFANIRTANVPTPFDIPLTVLSWKEYQMIANKDISTPIPNYIYMDGAFPNANIYLNPTPQVSQKLVLTVWKMLDAEITLNTIVQLPPAYRRALRYNLACNLAPEYNMAIPQDLLATVATLKQEIRIANITMNRLIYDPRATGTSTSGVYDINVDAVR